MVGLFKSSGGIVGLVKPSMGIVNLVKSFGAILGLFKPSRGIVGLVKLPSEIGRIGQIYAEMRVNC